MVMLSFTEHSLVYRANTHGVSAAPVLVGIRAEDVETCW